MRNRWAMLAAGAALALAGGCGGEALTAAGKSDTSFTPTPRASDLARAYERTGVEVDPRIAEACNLPTPRFDFDSTSVTPDGAKSLDRLAECFTSGPMAGRRLSLVGHADPRGSFDYNMALGHRRAASVERYLLDQGVSAYQIETTSRGELEATGTDEAGWARDRRVQITLLDDQT